MTDQKPEQKLEQKPEQKPEQELQMKIPEMVDALYGSQDLHPKLIEAAGWQINAHLVKLKAEGKVTGSGVKSVWKAC